MWSQRSPWLTHWTGQLSGWWHWPWIGSLEVWNPCQSNEFSLALFRQEWAHIKPHLCHSWMTGQMCLAVCMLHTCDIYRWLWNYGKSWCAGFYLKLWASLLQFSVPDLAIIYFMFDTNDEVKVISFVFFSSNRGWKKVTHHFFSFGCNWEIHSSLSQFSWVHSDPLFVFLSYNRKLREPSITPSTRNTTPFVENMSSFGYYAAALHQLEVLFRNWRNIYCKINIIQISASAGVLCDKRP